MNTYNENLQNTVDDTLAALLGEQATLKAVQLTNQLSRYNAQGMEMTAHDKYTDSTALARHSDMVNHQALINDSQVNKLLQSAAAAKEDVSASATNMATAAANVQIASAAIDVLAGDLGAALSNATGAMFGVPPYPQIENASRFINEVANDAKHLSRLAMEATSNTAEIPAAALVEQATGVQSKIDGLLAVTQADADRYAAQAAADKTALAKAIQAERLSEGTVTDGDRQVASNERAYGLANAQLNLGLHAHALDHRHISLSFSDKDVRLAKFRAAPANEIRVPSPDPAYYLMVVPQEQQSAFSYEQAELLFASAVPNVQFPRVQPDEDTPMELSHDVNGDSVRAGSSYVAYLYIRLAGEYQRYVGNYDDMLSSPSKPFLLADTLPAAEPLAEGTRVPLTPAAGPGEPDPICFQAGDAHTAKLAGLEFRCILVDTAQGADQPRIHFNLAIAEQVGPSGYSVAHAGHPPAADSKEGDTLAANGAPTYYVPISPTTADNFGNALRPGASYQPYILSVVDGDKNPHSDAYVNVLSDALPPVKIPAA